MDELPSNSRTNSAMLNDPESAAQMAERIVEDERARKKAAAEGSTGGKVEWTPDVAEWSLTHELLSQIRDTLIRVNSDKPKTVKEFPRPTTAVAAEVKRARTTVVEDSARDLVAQLTPWAAA